MRTNMFSPYLCPLFFVCLFLVDDSEQSFHLQSLISYQGNMILWKFGTTRFWNLYYKDATKLWNSPKLSSWIWFGYAPNNITIPILLTFDLPHGFTLRLDSLSKSNPTGERYIYILNFTFHYFSFDLDIIQIERIEEYLWKPRPSENIKMN